MILHGGKGEGPLLEGGGFFGGFMVLHVMYKAMVNGSAIVTKISVIVKIKVST